MFDWLQNWEPYVAAQRAVTSGKRQSPLVAVSPGQQCQYVTKVLGTFRVRLPMRIEIEFSSKELQWLLDGYEFPGHSDLENFSSELINVTWITGCKLIGHLCSEQEKAKCSSLADSLHKGIE